MTEFIQPGRPLAGVGPSRIPTLDGPRLSLGELKFISAGATRYPIGKTEKQVDRRARELPGSYRRPLEKLDEKLGTRPGETGRLVARLDKLARLTIS